MKPADKQHATAVPKMNPRLSAPTTRSMFFPRYGLASSSTASARPEGSARSGAMSRKRMPGLGKSRMSRISRLSRSVMGADCRDPTVPSPHRPPSDLKCNRRDADTQRKTQRRERVEDDHL